MNTTDDNLTSLCDEAYVAFRNGTVIQTSANKLKQWLVALSTIRPPAEETRQWNKARAEVIKHLLQVHSAETLHRRTFFVSILSLVVAVVSLAISILRN